MGKYFSPQFSLSLTTARSRGFTPEDGKRQRWEGGETHLGIRVSDVYVEEGEEEEEEEMLGIIIPHSKTEKDVAGSERELLESGEGQKREREREKAQREERENKRSEQKAGLQRCPKMRERNRQKKARRK
ncbi:hypothetical protein RUM44_008281 [Polyplax serrata]|uniref:Uncharacterized protein n=1 Tax=Polyplax serrata TaxID=468196 RepID=A0ABR1BBW2_POLSC